MENTPFKTRQAPNHFLQLLANDPWFAWLHPLSLLIVTMDQAIDSKQNPLTPADAEALIKQAHQLLVASEDGRQLIQACSGSWFIPLPAQRTRQGCEL